MIKFYKTAGLEKQSPFESGKTALANGFFGTVENSIFTASQNATHFIYDIEKGDPCISDRIGLTEKRVCSLEKCIGNELIISGRHIAQNAGAINIGDILVSGADGRLVVTQSSSGLYLQVIDLTTFEGVDSVVAIVKNDEASGAVGLWQFNQTISLAPMGTEWNVTWTAEVNGESIKFDHYSQQGLDADSFQLCSATVGACMPTYLDGMGWTSGSPLVIEFTGGDDIENPDFVAWLNANATPYTPPTVSGCWTFNDSPNYETFVSAQTSFTSNGQTWDSIIIPGNSEIQFSRNGESIVVYGYSTETYQDEWTDEAYKDICFTAETEVSAGFYAWLTANATHIET